MSVVGMLYNTQLMKYAGEDGVTAYGTIMYVNFIFIAIFIGYATGVAPVISYHYGAGKRTEKFAEKKFCIDFDFICVDVWSIRTYGKATGRYFCRI